MPKRHFHLCENIKVLQRPFSMLMGFGSARRFSTLPSILCVFEVSIIAYRTNSSVTDAESSYDMTADLGSYQVHRQAVPAQHSGSRRHGRELPVSPE